MTFTEQLRQENDDVFQKIFTHPFVDGIGRGDVPKDSIIHYVKADFEYLNAFMKIYALSMVKAKSRDDIRFFFDQIGFVLNDEVHPHHNFCDYVGVEYEALQSSSLPPTADHYIKHMMHHAQTGTIAEIYAALLPCPWTYLEIGQELLKTYKPTKSHPFYEWITFYADEEVERITLELRHRLDQEAQDVSQEQKQLIKEAFRKSCELEWKFWEMAYICETWPSEQEASRI
ncbi:thiaminase II [Tenuibacillus multivorans]|uniref:Aminopyrimidine aminohydrolase n=1 Tax=Tenuibacillus multivorans TaxID=237069 RepID=A0A1H0G1N8_9BACI|nr:thiaminase II [Tenuibacillus multivorans]GEL78119.1 aminopyrimidine aminohydrolase [Tenuibacillus multivorans]SDO00770.1 thiaminase (transcriptional activator TenA) [Tenuibacillus multivorans]